MFIHDGRACEEHTLRNGIRPNYDTLWAEKIDFLELFQ